MPALHRSSGSYAKAPAAHTHGQVDNPHDNPAVSAAQKSSKRDPGLRDVPVSFAGVTIKPGDWVYADGGLRMGPKHRVGAHWVGANACPVCIDWGIVRCDGPGLPGCLCMLSSRAASSPCMLHSLPAALPSTLAPLRSPRRRHPRFSGGAQAVKSLGRSTWDREAAPDTPAWRRQSPVRGRP